MTIYIYISKKTVLCDYTEIGCHNSSSPINNYINFTLVWIQRILKVINKTYPPRQTALLTELR